MPPAARRCSERRAALVRAKLTIYLLMFEREPDGPACGTVMDCTEACRSTARRVA